MYTVMVTGGIGSGKSKLVELLCERGAVSIDLDEINRALISGNAMLISELAARFGEEILDEDGAVIPARLAHVAFASEQATHDLNAISFPYIMQAATNYILNVECAPRTDAKILVVEVPLLTEAPDFARLADGSLRPASRTCRRAGYGRFRCASAHAGAANRCRARLDCRHGM